MSDARYEPMPGWCKAGVSVTVYYNEGNANNQTRHIRAIVDDEYVVYRVWFRHKRRWNYVIEWYYAFVLLERDGYIKRIK